MGELFSEDLNGYQVKYHKRAGQIAWSASKKGREIMSSLTTFRSVKDAQADAAKLTKKQSQRLNRSAA